MLNLRNRRPVPTTSNPKSSRLWLAGALIAACCLYAQPAEAGCTYDSLSGNTYCSSWDGSRLTGWNRKGESWNTTYRRDGASGVDKRGRRWNYNRRSGTYRRSDGVRRQYRQRW